MRKLRFKLVRNVMPLYGTSYTTCIGCDTTFKEMLNIKDDCLKQTGRLLIGNHNIGNISSTTSTMTSQSQYTQQQRPVSGHTRSVSSSNNISQPNRSNTANRNATISNDREDFSSSVSNFNSSENRLDQSVTSGNSYNTNNRTNMWGNIDNDAEIMCNCHKTAIQLTVKKEGPNKGKSEIVIFVIFAIIIIMNGQFHNYRALVL